MLCGMFLQPSNSHGHFVGQSPLLRSRKLAQPQQTPHPITRRPVFLFEPSMLATRDSTGRRGAHGAPVENTEEESNILGERKANSIFAFSLLNPAADFRLLQQSKTFHILVAPSSIFNHRAQSPNRKGITKRVIGDHDWAAVGMFEMR